MRVRTGSGAAAAAVAAVQVYPPRAPSGAGDDREVPRAREPTGARRFAPKHMGPVVS